MSLSIRKIIEYKKLSDRLIHNETLIDLSLFTPKTGTALFVSIVSNKLSRLNLMKLNIGDVFEFNYGDGNINNRTVEIKALFDDRVAIKTLKAASPHASLYAVEHKYTFECAMRTGHCLRLSN
jgi:hypothetical protein